MIDIVTTTEGRIVIILASLAIVLAIAFYVVSKVRSLYFVADEPLQQDWLGNVDQMYAEGELSDEEYRAIRAKMANELLQRIKQDDTKS